MRSCGFQVSGNRETLEWQDGPISLEDSFEPSKEALHKRNRNRLTGSARLVVGLALVALPDFHVSYLSWSSGLKILLDNVSAIKVELEIALRTLQRSTYSLDSVIMLAQKSIGVHCRLAPVSSRRHCLSVFVISYVPCRENPSNIRFSFSFRPDVSPVV